MLQGTEARAAVFLDRAAWQQAMDQIQADLRVERDVDNHLVHAPIRTRAVSFEDAGGVFTDPSEEAFVSRTSGGAPEVWWPRTFLLSGAQTDYTPGRFIALLGCASAFWPCLGAWSITYEFEQPVYGFAGTLDYFVGVMGFTPEPIPFFEAAFDAAQERQRNQYTGFFGVTGLMDSFTLTFRVGQSFDDFAYVDFQGVMVVVSEPPLALTFALLALVMLAVAHRATRVGLVGVASPR
ncbi:hypothetical protein [Elioraea sp.]|uniref:hypothetical protein n=1 Tax=Elioraea sp. TaxID=2185103 RepID=UPI0025C5E035|nr:hypothetical protein [Elioraea sp.]